MEAQSSHASWRRRLRFSIRALVVVVLCLGGGLGWIVYRARVQHRSVDAIQRMGGSALYDWQFKSGPVRDGAPWAPSWLIERIGADYFQYVTYVYLPNARSSEGLACIGQLDRLEMLMLGGPAVSDDGLTHLTGLTNLEVLYLSGTFSDRGLKHLLCLGRLKRLGLAGTNITDAGIVYLQHLNTLEELDLSRTQITDSGLVHLRGLTNLKKLGLQMTRISDAGLVHLRGLKNLRRLGLRGAKIMRNSSLAELRDALPNLEIDY
jgi:hypothetical protein